MFESEYVLNTDSSNHVPSFENISTQSSDFDSIASLKYSVDTTTKIQLHHHGSVVWRRTLSVTDDALIEEEL
jgi:hypothetical protein